MASRVARNPITLPKDVEIIINQDVVIVKGPKGKIEHKLAKNISVNQDEKIVHITAQDDLRETNALAGTTRAIINNHVIGVSTGYEIKLILKGVGYKALVKGQVLQLSLGFSHPVEYQIPTGITIESPSQTEILVKGSDKQKVGQVASEIRRYRPPEPYKGKGVRYADEVVVIKETKKK